VPFLIIMILAMMSTLGILVCWWDLDEWWMRSSRVCGWDLAEWWMRSSRVVRASDSQCHSRNCPGFDPSIFQHSGTWGSVLNIVHKIKNFQKSSFKKLLVLWRWWQIQNNGDDILNDKNDDNIHKWCRWWLIINHWSFRCVRGSHLWPGSLPAHSRK
jgi:hypothetical protein